MIIHRMKLRNFRGVDDREVDLEPAGVTILEGPNEAGKSSYIDALNLLLEYKSSSHHRDVVATKPVHRDEGPEAEIEAEAGHYRFRYRKRWMKKHLTELEIMTPAPDSLTGDEAHDRVQEMLSETTDMDLWRALRIMQGDGMRAVDLRDTEALSKALDVAAGATPVGQDETAIFQAAAAEYGQYWTATGKENKELKEAEAKGPELEADLQDADAALQAIEGDAARLDTLRKEVADTRAKGPELEARVANAKAAWEIANTAAKAAKEANTELELARERHESSANAKKQLEGLERKAADAKKALSEHERQAAAAPDKTAAGEEMASRQAAFDAAKAARKAAEDVERLRQADADDRHYALDLEQMRERKAAIDEVRSQAEEARKLVATSKATDEKLEALRAALDNLRAAEARLDAAAPHLRVESLAKGKVLVDGKALKTEERGVERRIESETVVEIPDHARIAVTPGGDIQEIRASVEEHQHDVDKLLQFMKAADWASASEANRKLAKAQGRIEDVADVERDKLRDLTYDGLVDKIAEVEARLEEYADGRDSELELPQDFDQARALLEKAQADAEKARKAEEAAERPLEGVRTRLQELENAHNELRTKTEVLQAQADAAEKNLEEAKEEHADTVARLEQLTAELSEKNRAWNRAQEDLRANDPETAKSKLDNAKEVLKAHDARLRQVEHDLTVVKARIEVHEEDGLFERRQALESKLKAARRYADGKRRRAEAARLVFDILSEERDAARQAYVRPLQEAIQRLGRILHGDTFQVQVGEDLSVTHRTLNGRTLEFKQLSAGAKEQLGILTRAACAILVAKGSRIPLILDDTLGNTDPERLEAMGVVLNRAGQDAQVIILTCVPDRFRHVGGAKVVRIAEGGN